MTVADEYGLDRIHRTVAYADAGDAPRYRDDAPCATVLDGSLSGPSETDGRSCNCVGARGSYDISFLGLEALIVARGSHSLADFRDILP